MGSLSFGGSRSRADNSSDIPPPIVHVHNKIVVEDKPGDPLMFIKADKRTGANERIEIDTKPRNPNPDPENYVIEWYCQQSGGFLIVEIVYPDCTNYEGRKILVFKDVTIEELKEQKMIDPHFANNDEFHSPVARFVPTRDGMKMAMAFAETMKKIEDFEDKAE
jgi:hypothetical protein